MPATARPALVPRYPAAVAHCTVVGAGIIGLAVADELEGRGHDVEIIADSTGGATTSAVAGAIWFPYRSGTSPRVATWARRTRDRWMAIAGAHPEAGVDVLDVYECTADGAEPWWAEGIELALVPAPVAGAPLAWRFRAPRIEPAVVMPWLEHRRQRPIRRDRAARLGDLPGDMVIHCSGLGARTLAADRSVEAVYGHVVVVEPGTIDLSISFTDDRPPGPIFYSIPRRTEVVLGGVSEPCDHDRALHPDPAVRDRILDQCRRLGWNPGRVLRERAGLRPFRPEVRVERDPLEPRIIHCYGHGGAGFTLAWGCAEAVADLVATGGHRRD